MDVKQAREEATKVYDKAIIRSCWNCNPAHEHLKKADYPFVCFECGHWFFKGVDITKE